MIRTSYFLGALQRLPENNYYLTEHQALLVELIESVVFREEFS